MPIANIPTLPGASSRRAAFALVGAVIVLAFWLLVGCDFGPTDSGGKSRLPTPTPLGTLGPIVNVGDDSDSQGNNGGTPGPTRPRPPTRTPTNTPTHTPTRTPTNSPTVGT